MTVHFQFVSNRVPVFTTVMGLFLVLFGLSSAVMKERLYMSEAVLTTIIGTVVGPHICNLFAPQQWSDLNTIVLEVTRLIIAMQIMAAVICLPTQYYRVHWKSMLWLLGPIMVVSWLVTAGVIHWVLAVPLPLALAIAAALSPTDPILANSIVKGKFADRHVPRHVRHLISAESAANDSTAALFILFSVYLIKYYGDAGKVAENFFIWVVLYEMVLGALYGVLCGWLARKALHYAQEHDLIDQENFLAFSLALSIFVDGSSVLLFINDFVAVVCAAVAFGWDGSFHDQTKQSPFQEILDNLANAWLFVLNGTIIPWPTILNATDPNMPRFWQYIVTGLAILAIRRIPITAACYRFMPSLTTFNEALFVGHFGPMAAGAVYYMAYIRNKLGPDTAPELEPTIQFVVVSSILVHGCTVPLFKLGSVAARTLSTGSSIGRRSRSRSVGRTSNKTLRTSIKGMISVSGPINARPMYSSAGISGEGSSSPPFSATGNTFITDGHDPDSYIGGPNIKSNPGADDFGSGDMSLLSPRFGTPIKRETTIEIREAHELERVVFTDSPRVSLVDVDDSRACSESLVEMSGSPLRGDSNETVVVDEKNRDMMKPN